MGEASNFFSTALAKVTQTKRPKSSSHSSRGPAQNSNNNSQSPKKASLLTKSENNKIIKNVMASCNKNIQIMDKKSREEAEFFDTKNLELSGGEFRLGRHTRKNIFIVLFVLALLHSVFLIYTVENLIVISSAVNDFNLLFKELKILPTIIRAHFVALCLVTPFIFFVIYRGYERDSSSSNARKNLPPPTGLYSLVLMLQLLIIGLLLAVHAGSKVLDGEKSSFKQTFVEGMEKYEKNATFKTQIDKFQIIQKCCGVDHKRAATERWKKFKFFDNIKSKAEKELGEKFKKLYGKKVSEGTSVPFSCCNISSPFLCDNFMIKDKRVYKQYSFTVELENIKTKLLSSDASTIYEDACDETGGKLLDVIGQNYEFIFLLECFCNILGLYLFLILNESTNDEYTNKQRPSVVRIPLFQPLINIVLVFVYYFYGSKFKPFSGLEGEIQEAVKAV